MPKVMIIYPYTGKFFQRGEDRCQIDVASSSVNSLRACNDLGYVAAILKKYGHEVFLKDYQVLKLDSKALIKDVTKQNPDVIFISTTNGSIYDDLIIVNEIKKIKSDTVIILKGAIFFNADKEIFTQLDLSNIDYLIGGEVEFIIGDLINAHYNNKALLNNIEGISYKSDGQWYTNNLLHFRDDIDSLPYPDRELMPNKLYINPATNKPMALVTTSKGCCFCCKYCLSPVLSGKKIRTRSYKSIFGEIENCVKKHNITNFFFKSDTFTMDKENVINLCKMLTDTKLSEKIEWVATSRVDTLDEEMICIMKQAGCKLIAIGFESGSIESLEKMKKNTTPEKNLEIAKLCKKYDIEILGHFLIGFPWEEKSHLDMTCRHIFEINADYIEISVVIPYLKTPIYEEYIAGVKNAEDILGFDSFNHVYENFSKIPTVQLKKFRKKLLLKYYTRISYIKDKLFKIKSIPVLINYVQYGLRLIKNSLF